MGLGPDPGDSMSRSHLGGLAAAALVGAVFAAVPHSADAAATGSGQNARALAAQSAHRLIASKPPALKIGAHEAFQAKPVQSSQGIQYAPYERTYRGLPVVGGDFVVVTDSHGQILSTSVAQTHKVDLASTKPSLARSTAVATARRQVPHATAGTTPHLVVWQHGTRSRLGWETRGTGHQGAMPPIKDIVVDARDRQVLQAKERVADRTGNSPWDGSNLPSPPAPSGTPYSMPDPSHPSIKCQNAPGNVPFTGPDDVWAPGVKTAGETACVDAMYVEDQENKMLSAWDGRNSFDGAGGGWPIPIGPNDEKAFYDGTQGQIRPKTQKPWIPGPDAPRPEQGHRARAHTPGG